MTLFIANLDFKITDGQLHDMFIIFGKISECKLITDRAVDKSKGYGFVSFAQDVAADWAIKAMHGLEINGRPLIVQKAKGKNTDQSQRTKRPRIVVKYNYDWVNRMHK